MCLRFREGEPEGICTTMTPNTKKQPSDIPKIIFIVNARMPNKKAYGIQIAQMCQAYVEAGSVRSDASNGAGVDLELVIPRTHASSLASLKDAFKLRVDIPTTILPGLDWYSGGRMLFFISSCVFICTSQLYLWWKKVRGVKALVYTVDMDTFSFVPLVLSGFPVVVEMHDQKPRNIFTRFFFKRAKLIIATNTEIQRALAERFGIPTDRMLIEPNGVDLNLFMHTPTRDEARRALAIPQDQKIALYVGRFYEWKGLDILVDAAQQAPDMQWYVVGDTRAVFERVAGRTDLPANLHIAGACEPSDVPRWLAAADALLVLGTKRNEQSYRHTAPMKVYEYMAARRPIVASRTPALTSMIAAQDAVWYEPDDAHSLALTAQSAVSAPDSAALDRAFVAAQSHSWKERVKRIISKLQSDAL
ncbi:glycosyltransferase family 4 protein [Candidatus Kaiserbacteria bacterium]|nr:glycosyltransferase family 4 protein [Candidatus Kaiserbacteria bacterium]